MAGFSTSSTYTNWNNASSAYNDASTSFANSATNAYPTTYDATTSSFASTSTASATTGGGAALAAANTNEVQEHPTFLQLGQYSAWITMDLAIQKVYDVRYSEDGRGVECWIASEAGKKFTVTWHNSYRDQSIVGVVKIDGVVCNESVMLDAWGWPNKSGMVSVGYKRTSEVTRRDFEFARIWVTDDDSYLHTLSDSYDFGTIEIQLWRMRITNVIEAQPIQHQYAGTQATLEDQVLHERSKKAGAHHVRFGTEYVVVPSLMDRCFGYRMDSEPMAIMTFRYRPMNMLMALGVVPRPKAVLVEIQQLEARLQSLRSLPSVKTTQAAAQRRNRRKNRPGAATVKTEPSDVIDLT